eukprot:scaffold267054_cov31-Tisochrysis_lutea.AAC.1
MCASGRACISCASCVGMCLDEVRKLLQPAKAQVIITLASLVCQTLYTALSTSILAQLGRSKEMATCAACSET